MKEKMGENRTGDLIVDGRRRTVQNDREGRINDNKDV